MPFRNPNDMGLLVQIIVMFKDVLLGLVGGLVAYLLKFQKKREVNENHPFSWSSLVINMLLGGYVSYLVGSSLPTEFHYHDFIVGSVGVASYPILLFIESNFLKIILKRFQLDTKEKK